jgi:acyl carrier protein
MSIDISKSIADLSPQRRELLLRKLKERQQPDLSFGRELPALIPDPENRYEPFPLSDIQQSYWIGRSGYFDLGNCGTNVYMEVEFEGVGEWFVERFNNALQRLIERHEMLRAIITTDGQQQILSEVPEYKLSTIDLRGKPVKFVEERLKKERLHLRSYKAKIDQWPLFDFIAYLLDKDNVRLLIRIDAMLIDGTSRNILTRELLQLIIQPETVLPTLSCSYRDYVLAWTKLQNSSLVERSKEYWLSRLESLPPSPTLPQIVKRDSTKMAYLGNRDLQLLNREQWTRIKELGAARGLTPSAIVITAFIDILRLWSTHQKFTISIVGSYRPPIHPQMDSIIGNFNTINLLSIDNQEESFEDRAKSLQEQLTTDMEYNYYSGFQVLRRLHQKLGSYPTSAMPILFNSLLYHEQPGTYQAKEDRAIRGKESSVRKIDIEASVCIPQVLLIPTVMKGDDGSLLCKWQAVEEHFPFGLIDEMIDSYKAHLKDLAETEGSWSNTDKCYLQVYKQDHNYPLEHRLIRLVWKEFLGKESFSNRDDFYQCGGDSLSLVQMLYRIEQIFNKRVPISVLVNGINVENLAQFLKDGM